MRIGVIVGASLGAWDPAYDNAEIIAWLLKQQRKATVGGH